MTRKHAALRAIELLSGNEQNREICEVLGKIAWGKLSNDWNKELVLESIEDFIEEHGYYPTSKEMDNDPMMPAHASAYLAMGMGYTKVKETYFPNVLTKIEQMQLSCEEWMERFKVLYAEMGMPSACEYTRRRPAGEATANTWVKRIGCDSWNDLLIKSGYEKCVRTHCNHHSELTAMISESELSFEEYEKMEEELSRLLM